MEFAGSQQNTQQMVIIPRALAERQASGGASVFLRGFALTRPSLSCPTLIGHPGSLVFHAGCRPRAPTGRLRGFAPARRGPFVSAKGPKTIGARAWPHWGAFAPVPIIWAAELASLRQSSPLNRILGTGAQPRPEAPGQDICICCHSRLDRESSVFILSNRGQNKDTGSSIKNVEDDRRGGVEDGRWSS